MPTLTNGAPSERSERFGNVEGTREIGASLFR